MTGLDVLQGIGFVDEGIIDSCLKKRLIHNRLHKFIRYAVACVTFLVAVATLLIWFFEINQISSPIQTQTVDYGCYFVPVVQIHSQNYLYQKDISQISLPTDMFFVGKCIFVEHGATNEQNAAVITCFQEFVDASVWMSDSFPNLLFVERDGMYHLFVLETLTYDWIYYNDRLFLYEGCFVGNKHEREPHDSSVLENGAIPLGVVVMDAQYTLPSKQLSTNSTYVAGLLAYAVPGQDDYIIVAVPKGLQNEQTRYDRYYIVSITSDQNMSFTYSGRSWWLNEYSVISE